MRPLPRLHAITTEAVLARTDLGVRAAALAAAGPAVALHARGHSLSGAALVGVVTRFLSLAGPPEASVFAPQEIMYSQRGVSGDTVNARCQNSP